MELFHAYQSRSMQFALDVIALVERKGAVREDELRRLALSDGLSYADQVLKPLCNAGILQKVGNDYRIGEEFKPFQLPMGQVERDYLQYILRLPEASLFLQEQTIKKLKSADEEAAFFDPVERYEPKGASLPAYPGPEGFRTVLRAIRQKRMIRYEYRTKANDAWSEAESYPWKLEYSAYDRRWWIIVYLPDEDRTVKARLENLRNIRPDRVAKIPEKAILSAVDRLLAPQPMVLEVEKKRGALERCFMVFESQLFVETKQLSADRFRLAFQYYRFDETELLRRLLYLGPMVTLIGPDSAREKLRAMVETALER